MGTENKFYAPSPQAVAALKARALFEVSLGRAIFGGVLDFLSICVAIFIAFTSFKSMPWGLALPVQLIAILVVARNLRALECLVHEASHLNWNRDKAKNDFWANVICALPLFSTVERYRSQHSSHHRYFATTKDPDFFRYQEAKFDDLDRTRILGFTRGIADIVVDYSRLWWRTIGSDRSVLLMGLIWHTVVFLLPLLMIMDGEWEKVLCIWGFYILIPLLIVLPVLRCIGEAAEHRYKSGEDIFDMTVSNVGLIHAFFFHPHNDGYHLLHHLLPNIPFYRLKKADRFLRVFDAENYGARNLVRTSILQNPKSIKGAIYAA